MSKRENEACCHYCGHALTLTKVGMFPLHHPYGSISCEGSGKDPRTTGEARRSPVETTGGSARPIPREGSERLTSGPDDALTVEANKWLQMCGSCDAGLTMNCTCPEGDYRSLIHRLDMARVALTAEVERAVDAVDSLEREIDRLKAGREIERTMIRNAVDQVAERDATIERLWAQLNEATNTLVCAESCAGQSWTGVDQAQGPDKVWRCDTCGRIVSQSVSNP